MRRLFRNIFSSPLCTLSQFIDWSLCLVIFLVGQGINFFFEPFHRYAPSNDGALDYPRETNSVPIWLVAIFTIVIPGVVFLLFQLKYRSRFDVNAGFLGLACSLAYSNFFTNIAKTFAGRLRPDWIARQVLSESTIKDGRMSYISGHTSMAFAGLTYLSLYLAGKMKIFSRETWRIACLSLLSIPILIAFLIGISRTRDFRHNFSDINAGAFCGIVFASIGYFLYYPSLFSEDADLPRPSSSSSHIPEKPEEEEKLNIFVV